MQIPIGTLINQRYLILDILGKGGSGIVYRVQDQLHQGVERALKALRVDFANEAISAMFKREFRILSSIEHPSIAKVFDFGVVTESTPNTVPIFFFTSEYVAGGSLFKSVGKYTIDDLIELITQICRALDFLASRGLVHRDLKSSNVLVTQQQGRAVVKIVDFGIAVELLRYGQYDTSGTILFMAPEILRGEEFDSRADLYSLGVMFYYLLTERYPFEAQSMPEMVTEHRTRKPVVPHAIRPEIPLAVSTIVLKLLEMEPSDRFFSARQVIEELQRSSSRPTNGSADTPTILTSYSPNFVGREGEMHLLENFYRKVMLWDRPHEGACLIAGETGSGKSKILTRFKNYLQLEQIRVFSVSISSAQKGLAPFLTIAKELLPLLSSEVRDQQSLAIAHLQDVFSPESILEDQKEITPDEKFKIEKAFMGIFIAAARSLSTAEVQGIAFLFDDVHYFSKDSGNLFQSLAYSLRAEVTPVPLLLIATYNSHLDPNIDHFFSPQDPLDTDSRAFAHIRLKPLAMESIEELLFSSSGINFNESMLATSIRKLTGGNALFVQEVIRSLFEKLSPKDLTRQLLESRLEELVIPESVVDILSDRVKSLEVEEQMVLNLLSAFGEPSSTITLGEIRQSGAVDLFKGHSIDMLTVLDRLINKGILRRNLLHGQVYYQFENALLRNIVYEAIPQKEQERYHLQVAKFLEAQGKSTPDSARLADHYLRTSDHEKAFSYAIQAAQDWARRSAWGTAIFYYEKAIQVAPERERSRLHVETARLSMLQGDLTRAENHYIKLEKRLATENIADAERCQVFCKLGELYDLMLKPTEAMKALEVAQSLSKKSKDGLQDLRICWIRGRVLFRFGQYQRVYDESNKRLKRAEKLSAREEYAELLYNRGLSRSFLGQPNEAIEDLLHCHTVFAELKNPHRCSFALNGLGFIHHQNGRLADALQRYRRAYEIATHIGETRYLINYATNLATIFHELQEFDQAQEYYERALDVAERGLQRGEKAKILKNVGNLFIQYGHFSGAEEMLHKSLEISRDMDLRDEISAASLFLGELYVEIENWHQAEICFTESLEIARKFQYRHLEINALYGLVAVSLAHLDLEKAEDLLQQTSRLDEEPAALHFKLTQNWHWVDLCMHRRTSSPQKESMEWEVRGKQYLEKALTLSRNEKNPRTLWKLWFLRGEFFREIGNHQESLSSFIRAQRLVHEFARHIPEEFRHYFFATAKVMRLRNLLGDLMPSNNEKPTRAGKQGNREIITDLESTGVDLPTRVYKQFVTLFSRLTQIQTWERRDWFEEVLQLMIEISGFQHAALIENRARKSKVIATTGTFVQTVNFLPEAVLWVLKSKREVFSFELDADSGFENILRQDPTNDRARAWLPLQTKGRCKGVVYLEGLLTAHPATQKIRVQLDPFCKLLALKVQQVSSTDD